MVAGSIPAGPPSLQIRPSANWEKHHRSRWSLTATRTATQTEMRRSYVRITNRSRKISKAGMLVGLLVLVVLGLAQETERAGASHTEIFLSYSNVNAIRVASILLTPGEPVDLYIWAVDVDNATGVSGFTLTLTFDETKVSVSSAPGDLDGIGDSAWLDATRPGAFCLPETRTPQPGRIVGACFSLGTLPGSVGTGLLGHLVLQAETEASASVLAFVEPEFGVLSTHIVSASEDPVAIPATLLNSSVSVAEAPTPEPPTQAGDVNCDGIVNPLDAALILQLSAGLLSQLACPPEGDTNADGVINPLDAALVLQFSAGLLDTLPP